MESMINIFKNQNVLNIFCDASLRNRGQSSDICYGAIAVYMNDVIDSYCRVNTDCTSNFGEAQAMTAAMYLAVKYRDIYPIINIFADSMLTVNTFRNFYKGWHAKDGYVYNKRHDIVSNQSPYLEAMKVIMEYDLNVNIFHVKAHVELNKFPEILNATRDFVESNYIKREVDYAFIRYICGYNNLIDAFTRSLLLRTDTIDYKVVAPFNNLITSKQLDEFKHSNGINKIKL